MQWTPERKLRGLASVAASIGVLLAPPALAAVSQADALYRSMLAAAVASQPSIDGWRDLRYAYAATPGYDPRAGAPDRARMLAEFRAGDCTAALAAARAVEAADYVEAAAHLVAAACDDKLGHDEDAGRELAAGRGLVASIESSGDGASPARAMVVISTQEAASVMRLEGRRIGGQALFQQNGHRYDAITALGDHGARQIYYFNIDRATAAPTTPGALATPGAVSEGGPPQ